MRTFGETSNKNKTNNEFYIKYIIVGDNKVGKTNIAKRFVDKENISEYSETIGADDYKYTHKKDEKIYTLKISDISGNPKFHSTVKRECKNSDFVLLVFDITNEESFLSIKKWKSVCNESGNNDLNFILVGNKNDLKEKRKIDFERAKTFAEKNTIKYYDISAFNEEDVKNIFIESFDSFYNNEINKANEDQDSEDINLDVINDTISGKSKCSC